MAVRLEKSAPAIAQAPSQRSGEGRSTKRGFMVNAPSSWASRSMLTPTTRLIIPFLLLFGSAGAAFAQLSVKGGIAVSGFRLSPDDGGTSREIDFRPFLGYEVGWIQHGTSNPDIGFQVGVSYAARLSRDLSVQPELHFAQRGYWFEQIGLYNTSYRLTVHYLQIPLLLTYRLPFDWAVRPGLLLGPYVSFRLSATRSIEIWGKRDTRSVPAVNFLDCGLIFAVDGEFSAWSQTLGVELRFDLGLADALSQPQDYTNLAENPGTVRVLALSALLCYRF